MPWNPTLNDDLAGTFTDDHRGIDAVWAEIEAAVDEGSEGLDALRERVRSFVAHMNRHLAMEEEVLFPAFERATGMVNGPTQVMRMEHEQMRSVLVQIEDHAKRGDFGGALDHGDTLHMLIQQHNMKEEGMLYRMAAAHLSWPDLKGQLKSYVG